MALIVDWYARRQQTIVNNTMHCMCGGIFDYVCSYWWRCRACADWVKRW